MVGHRSGHRLQCGRHKFGVHYIAGVIPALVVVGVGGVVAFSAVGVGSWKMVTEAKLQGAHQPFVHEIGLPRPVPKRRLASAYAVFVVAAVLIVIVTIEAAHF